MKLRLGEATKIVDALDVLTAQRASAAAYTYVLRLRDPGGTFPEGALYLEKGAVVGARLGEQSGISALYLMFDYQGECESDILASVPEHDRNVHFLTVARLLEAYESRRSLGARIQNAIPTMQAMPVPRKVSAETRDLGLRLPLRLFGAWFYMDGRRSISEIARLADIDELSLCQLVLQLQDDGLLDQAVFLPSAYLAARVRLLSPQGRRGAKVRYSESAKRLLAQLEAEDTLAAAAERSRLEAPEAARAALELFHAGTVQVMDGELELQQLAERDRR